MQWFRRSRGFTLVEVIVVAVIIVILIAVAIPLFSAHGMSGSLPVRQAMSGAQKANAAVVVQANGLTQEQENVKRRIEMENKPGAVQHLYIMSAYSGQVLLYSTVKGKVTSSGKRISPATKAVISGEYRHEYNPELLGDDGTYGQSIEYLYWWDVQGRYHQQYVSGGLFVHIADQPMQFGRVTLQVEAGK
jgi:prepilin-type N-terminal cleavage/methylation domain-containing protein